MMGGSEVVVPWGWMPRAREVVLELSLAWASFTWQYHQHHIIYSVAKHPQQHLSLTFTYVCLFGKSFDRQVNILTCQQAITQASTLQAFILSSLINFHNQATIKDPKYIIYKRKHLPHLSFFQFHHFCHPGETAVPLQGPSTYRLLTSQTSDFLASEPTRL